MIETCDHSVMTLVRLALYSLLERIGRKWQR